MSYIQFKLKEIPHAEGEKSLGYFPVLAHAKRWEAERIYAEIEQMSTVSSADIKAVLDALAYVLGMGMKDGFRVDVPELGSFAPAITCDYRITDVADKQIARHLSVSGIDFRPKASLTTRVADTIFRRADEGVFSAHRLTLDEVKERVRGYFSAEGNLVMERSAFESLVHCRKTKALSLLRTLVDEGFLKRGGRKNAPYYLLNE